MRQPDQATWASLRGRAAFAGLGYALAVLLTGTNLPTPLYPGYERLFRLSPFAITLLVAVYAGAVIVALLGGGPVADTAGYRPVLLAGLAAAAAGAALLAAAAGPAWLYAGRAVQGLAVGTCSGALTAGLVLTEPRGRTARASLWAATVTTAACGAGPVLAGALAQYAPAPRRLCFLAEIALLVPALAAVARLPAGLGRSGTRWRPRRPSLPPGLGPRFARAAVTSLLAWAVAYVVLALVPSYAAATVGGSLLLGGAAAGSLLLVAAVAQAACRSWATARAETAGLLGLAGGLAGLVLAGATGRAAVLFAAMVVAGAGQGLAFMAGVRRVNEMAPPGARAGTVALFYVVTYAGSGLVTAGTGLLASGLGLRASVSVFAAVLGAACLATLAAPGGRRRQRAGPRHGRHEAMAELIPRRVLFGNPERVSPRISPDGTRLAWIAPHGGVLNVWLAPVGPGGVDWAAARVITDDTDRGIRMFAWAHDARHVLYLQDTGGDENWRLHDVDTETMQRRDLTPFDGVRTELIAGEKKFPTEILVGLNKDNPELHDVYRLSLTTGELAKEVDNPGFIGWLADTELTVRAGLAPQPDGGMVIMVRDSPGQDWRPLLAVPAQDALTSGPVAFSEDGRTLLAESSVGADTGRLIRFDLATGAEEVLAADPEADVAGVRLHPDTREPQIVTFLKDRMEYRVLDPEVQPDLDAIRALNPGDPVLADHDDADRIWLVAFSNDTGATTYYSYDRETRTGAFLLDSRPELARYGLAAMEPFTYTARDGLVIHGYATFPPGLDREGLPMVLNVHGGPWARDAWGFDPEAQWLANRGYLCVQVNFRGSTGYGKAFVNAGDRQWGAAMQDDLTDAVAHAVARGWADPARVAIYGGSYGGYAALAGAAFTPEVFRCAVDIVGPSNLRTLIETIPPYWAPMIAQFHTRVGDPEKDADFLWSRSPLSRAADIRIPLLIAQGANDPRVKQAESEQIVAALTAAGIDHEYLLFPDEGHGFAKPENRLRFYAAAERFLARHLGGRAED